MKHRVTKLEFVPGKGTLKIRAMGRTGRGTKFHIRSVVLNTDGLTQAEVASVRAAAIEKLLVSP